MTLPVKNLFGRESPETVSSGRGLSTEEFPLPRFIPFPVSPACPSPKRTWTASALLPVPDFGDLIAPQSRFTTPSTPCKKTRGAPAPIVRIPEGPWEKYRPTPLGRGSFMEVSRHGEWVIKTVREDFRKEEADKIFLNVIHFRQRHADEFLPVTFAKIENEATAVGDRCIVMKYYPGFDLRTATDEQKEQYKALIQKIWDTKIPVDAKPSNIRVDEAGNLVLIDWDSEEKPNEIHLLVQQVIRLAAGRDREFRAFLMPTGENVSKIEFFE